MVAFTLKGGQQALVAGYVGCDPYSALFPDFEQHLLEILLDRGRGGIQHGYLECTQKPLEHLHIRIGFIQAQNVNPFRRGKLKSGQNGYLGALCSCPKVVYGTGTAVIRDAENGDSQVLCLADHGLGMCNAVANELLSSKLVSIGMRIHLQRAAMKVGTGWRSLHTFPTRIQLNPIPHFGPPRVQVGAAVMPVQLPLYPRSKPQLGIQVYPPSGTPSSAGFPLRENDWLWCSAA